MRCRTNRLPGTVPIPTFGAVGRHLAPVLDQPLYGSSDRSLLEPELRLGFHLSSLEFKVVSKSVHLNLLNQTPANMSTTTSPSTREDVNKKTRVKDTLDAVHWSEIANRVCPLYSTEAYDWGETRAGGYNVVRFLHLPDAESTELVVRVPYSPADGWTSAHSLTAFKRISSEVATMRYVEKHTTVPVPRVIEYSAESKGVVGSPYIVMSKAEGVPLFTLWDDMEDERRTVLLKQVVDILLELSLHRFDKIGSLVEVQIPGIASSGSSSHDGWVIAEKVPMEAGEEDIERVLSSRVWTNAIEYWVAYANARLARVDEECFGEPKNFHYAHYWLIRSLIPALYDTFLDEAGFPLLPHDFHTQNIMVKNDVKGQPCITALIDWEFSCTVPTSSFAQYPIFIMDHPFLDDDDPHRQRNVLDRETFDKLFRQAEARVYPNSRSTLTDAFASSKGVYLLEQLIQCPYFYSELFPQLMEHVYGQESLGALIVYLSTLLETGLLKEFNAKYEEEGEVRDAVAEVLGDLPTSQLDRKSFVTLAREHIDEFPEGGTVRKWLADRAKVEGDL
jgi:aminoglycoside phosphotransferase (APT) family kinase protein